MKRPSLALAAVVLGVACTPPPPPAKVPSKPVPTAAPAPVAPPRPAPKSEEQAKEEWARIQADPRFGRGIDIIAESHLPEYVRGFPMHMAITIQMISGETIGVYGAGLPSVHDDWVRGIEITFTNEGSGTVRHFGKYIAPGGTLGGPCPEPYFPFPERPKRLFFNAARVEGVQASLEAGRYKVEIVYDKAPAPVFEIVLRDPTPAQRQELASIASYLRARHQDEDDWDMWVYWGRAPARPPTIAKTDPLRYYKVRRYLYTMPTALEAIDPRVLDALDGFYAPEAELLRADLARLRHDEAAFKRHADTIRASFPGVVEELETIEKGWSYLKVDRETASRYGTRIPPR